MFSPPATQWPCQPWGLSPRLPRALRVHTAWHPGLCTETQAQWASSYFLPVNRWGKFSPREIKMLCLI